MTQSRLMLLGLIPAAFIPIASGQTVPSGYVVETVVTGLQYPTTMAFLGPGDAFVLEEFSGHVKRVRFGGGPPIVEIVLTLAVNQTGTSGLLGIALAPDFATTGDVFLYYTGVNPTRNRIDRFTWNGTTLTFAGPVRALIGGDSYNNGGVIAFGPDGKLYAVIGDLNADGPTINDPFPTTVLEHGVVLRLNRDGSPPADNPFVSRAGWERIYGYGVRNSFGLAFDPLTGALWNTENGPENYDEVNRLSPGYNSGWRPIMGPDARDPDGIGDLIMIPGAVYVDPVFSWFSPIGPTAIVFIGSIRWPASIRNDCLVADVVTNSLSLLDMNPARNGFVLCGGLSDLVADDTAERDQVRWGTGFEAPTDLEIGPDGYLYVVSINTGIIRRIRPQFPMGDIDRDGQVDGSDIREFVGVLYGGITDPLKIAQADFNGNGSADSDDLAGFMTSLLLLP